MSALTSQPFGSISIKGMRLKWMRDSKYHVDLQLFGRSFQSSFFEQEQDGYLEKGFIGALDKIILHKSSSDDIERKSSFELKEVLSYGKKFEFENSGVFEIENYNEKELQFNLKVLMLPTGEKTINVLFSDVKILAQTSIYMNLFYFFMIDPSVYPEYDESNKK